MRLSLTVTALFFVPKMNAGFGLTHLLSHNRTWSIAKEIAAATMFIKLVLICLSLPTCTLRHLMIMLLVMLLVTVMFAADITFWLAVMPSMPQMPNMSASLPWLGGNLDGSFEQDGFPDL